MIRNFKMLFSLFSSKDKKKLALIFVGILFMGVWEIVGIGSIMPFISVVSEPGLIQTNQYLRWAYTTFGFDSTESFLIVFGIGVVGMLVVSNGSRALLEYGIQRFSAIQHHQISLALLRRYLYQPYVFFLNQNSSDLSKNILGEVYNLLKSVLIPGLEMLSRIMIGMLIVGLLMVVDPVLALLMAAVFSSIYAVIYWIARKKIEKIGRKRLELNKLRYKITAEVFGGIKDVKLLGKEDAFCDLFEKPSRTFSINTAKADIIADLPKYALETVAFSSILIIILYLLAVKGDFQQAIPLVGLYAFAAFRLMPALQVIFRGSVKIKAHIGVIELFYRHLREEGALQTVKIVDAPRMDFSRSIELRNISFTYPNMPEPVLKDQNLEIIRNTTVGFAGHTGCGKTTLVDIILGLLSVQDGAVLVDGVPLGVDNIRGWQKNLGYVPQSIFLSDDTAANNIAFGIPEKDVDMGAVESASRAANIHDFIMSELPNGYSTVVGERGVRLSGGQRQRIGIARALYHNPAVLILDEATSALDGVTENAIMDAIGNLSGQKTIIMIAHRLTTVRQCDVIYYLEKGKIVDSGSYEELVERNEYFKRMAQG